MSNAERVSLLMVFLWTNRDADEVLEWIGANMEVGDVFDLHGPQVRAIIDEAIRDYDGDEAHKRDVNQSLRPRASEL